jgi:hypothetical protein
MISSPRNEVEHRIGRQFKLGFDRTLEALEDFGEHRMFQLARFDQIACV